VDAFGDSLIEGLDDAVVVADARLMVVAWNGAMERLTGLPKSVVVGHPAAAALSALRGLDAPALLERALAGETVRTGEVVYGRTDGGQDRWLEARYVPWRNARGERAGVIGLHTEITERRRRQAFVGAIDAIGRSLTSSLDLEEVLDTLVHRALDVMSADSALVVSWDGTAPMLTVMRAAGRLSKEYVAAGVIPVSRGPASRCMQEGKPIVTSNVLTDPAIWLAEDRRAEIAREGFKAVGAAPLRSKGRVHGALLVYYWTERTFSEDDVTVLTLFAEQAAFAIDNARVYADATRRAERLRDLAVVEQLVTESLVVDDVLRRIAQATARLLGSPVVQVWTADTVERVLRLQASAVEPGGVDVRMPRTVRFGEGIGGRVAESKAPIYVSDVGHDPRALSAEWARETGITRMLSVPILSGDDLLGVLTVRARTDTLALDENRRLVTSFAACAAAAMHNARVYDEAVRRAGRLRDLVGVSQSITASLDSTDVMQRIAQAAAGMRPGALAAVHVHDADRKLLRTQAVSSDDWRELRAEGDWTAGLPGLVATKHVPVLIPQPALHPKTIARDWWLKRPKSSYYGVPISVGDTFVGVLDYILPDELPDPEEQEALRLLAAQAGVAIRNAGLYQAERGQAERIRLLATINQRLSSDLVIDALLKTITESAAQLTGVRLVSVWLADEHARTLTIVGGSVPEMVEDFPPRVVGYDAGVMGSVARHRKPVVVDDVASEERILSRDWWQRWSLCAFAAYPVVAGDELLAALCFCHTEPIRFTRETADVIDMFVAQASIAVQNARLYREAQRRRDTAEALARLARELTGTLDTQRVAELVSRGIVQLLGGGGCVLYALTADSAGLRALGSFGGAASPALHLEPGEGTAGRAVAERKMVVTPDVLREPGITLSPALRVRVTERGYGAIAAVPLLTHDRVIGAITVADRTGRVLTGEERQTLQAFADQTALALENARLYETARDSLTRLRDAQAQLVQAAKMSALGQLVSGVAHELNNPLSVIIGYGQLLLGRDVGAAVRRPVELMVSQGDRMAKIVRNLLYFARQRPPERAAVEINHVIEQTLALRINQLELSGITVVTEFAPGLPVITGDTQQLEQVFLNLILNAEQAIKEVRTHGCITVRTRLTDDGRTIVADVVDDGPGIAPEAISRVFEPFYTTKTVGSGTGLGLSVSYGIVEEHQGRLSVRSRPGETVFTLELPVRPPPRPRAESAVERPDINGLGKVALVVEDEPSVVDLVVALLAEAGWRVDVAQGGHDALDLVRSKAYDLVVSDMKMPDGDGRELYREILAYDARLAQRFVFITGDTANPDAWAFLEGHEVPVIEKPFGPDAFEHAVHRVVSA